MFKASDNDNDNDNDNNILVSFEDAVVQLVLYIAHINTSAATTTTSITTTTKQNQQTQELDQQQQQQRIPKPHFTRTAAAALTALDWARLPAVFPAALLAIFGCNDRVLACLTGGEWDELADVNGLEYGGRVVVEALVTACVELRKCDEVKRLLEVEPEVDVGTEENGGRVLPSLEIMSERRRRIFGKQGEQDGISGLKGREESDKEETKRSKAGMLRRLIVGNGWVLSSRTCWQSTSTASTLLHLIGVAGLADVLQCFLNMKQIHQMNWKDDLQSIWTLNAPIQYQQQQRREFSARTLNSSNQNQQQQQHQYTSSNPTTPSHQLQQQHPWTLNPSLHDALLLQLAAQNGHVALIDVLFDYFAASAGVDDDALFADLAACDHHALRFAAFYGRLDAVLKLLKAYGDLALRRMSMMKGDEVTDDHSDCDEGVRYVDNFMLRDGGSDTKSVSQARESLDAVSGCRAKDHAALREAWKRGHGNVAVALIEHELVYGGNGDDALVLLKGTVNVLLTEIEAVMGVPIGRSRGIGVAAAVNERDLVAWIDQRRAQVLRSKMERARDANGVEEVDGDELGFSDDENDGDETGLVLDADENEVFAR